MSSGVHGPPLKVFPAVGEIRALTWQPSPSPAHQHSQEHDFNARFVRGRMWEKNTGGRGVGCIIRCVISHANGIFSILQLQLIYNNLIINAQLCRKKLGYQILKQELLTQSSGVTLNLCNSGGGKPDPSLGVYKNDDQHLHSNTRGCKEPTWTESHLALRTNVYNNAFFFWNFT